MNRTFVFLVVVAHLLGGFVYAAETSTPADVIQTEVEACETTQEKLCYLEDLDAWLERYRRSILDEHRTGIECERLGMDVATTTAVLTGKQAEHARKIAEAKPSKVKSIIRAAQERRTIVESQILEAEQEGRADDAASLRAEKTALEEKLKEKEKGK